VNTPYGSLVEQEWYDFLLQILWKEELQGSRFQMWSSLEKFTTVSFPVISLHGSLMGSISPSYICLENFWGIECVLFCELQDTMNCRQRGGEKQRHTETGIEREGEGEGRKRDPAQRKYVLAFSPFMPSGYVSAGTFDQTGTGSIVAIEL
jgi:hypothetical protein